MPTPLDVAFARAVSARTGKLRVGDAANRYRERAWGSDLPKAPYAVYLAGPEGFHTFALDVDASSRDRGRQARALSAALDSAGIRHIKTTSGTPGRRHLIATFTEPLDVALVAAVARALRDRFAPDLDITPLMNPATGCLRPPLSPHRGGGMSRPIGPSKTALRILRAGNPAHAFRLLATQLLIVPSTSQPGQRAPRVRRPLNPHLARLMREGLPNDPDRSATAAKITLGLFEAGYTAEEHLELVHDERNAGLDHLRRRRHRGELMPRHDIDAAAARMWKRRTQFAQDSPARSTCPTANPALDEVAAAVSQRVWGGKSGPAERVVLEVLLATARRIGSDEVGMAVRSLVGSTGLSRSAAGRALKRLTEKGWVEVTTPASGQLAATYRLMVPAPGPLASPSGTLAPAPPAIPALELQVTARRHDVFTGEGLGHGAGLLMDLLSQRQRTRHELAAVTGLSRHCVDKHLRRMAALGLVRTQGDLLTANMDALPAAARSLRVVGVVRRRLDVAAREQRAWRWWQEDFEAERGWSSRRGLRQLGHRRTSRGLAAPAAAFPVRADGRRCWRSGLQLVDVLTPDYLSEPGTGRPAGLHSDRSFSLTAPVSTRTGLEAPHDNLVARTARRAAAQGTPTASVASTSHDRLTLASAKAAGPVSVARARPARLPGQVGHSRSREPAGRLLREPWLGDSPARQPVRA